MVIFLPFSHSGINVHRVWFDLDLFWRETALDQFPPLEFREGDRHIDHVRPRTQSTMGGEHRGHHTRGCPASSIASVHNAGPRRGLANTIFTHVSIAEAQSVGTNQPVVM